MKKMYTYVVAALLIVACSLWFYHANAKVCFLADESDCGQDATGGDLDPYGNGGTEDLCCGTDPDTNSWYSTYPYKVSDSSCKRADLCTEGVFGAPCSHDTRYGICCPRKYQYNSCAAPLVQDGGRCGNKYACKCNDDCTAGKTCYKYYTNSSGACTDGSSYSETNAIPTGAQCLQISYDTGSAVEQMRYEKCECMKALFPYPADDDNAKCKQDFGDGAIVNTDSDACTEPSNDKFYKKCKCLPAYNITTCPYGLKEGANNDYCNAEGMYKYRDDACCKYNSNSCHYETAPGSEQGVKTYAECDCPSGKYTATSCEEGYKLTNGKCIKMSCKGALQAYFETHPSNSYVLYESDDFKTQTSLCGDQVDDLSDDVEAIIVADDTNPNTTQWTHFTKRKVISGLEFALTNAKGDSEEERNVQEQCTKVPTISAGRKACNSWRGTGATADFTAVKLKFNNEIFYPKLNCINCAIQIEGDVTFDRNVTLSSSNYEANSPLNIEPTSDNYPLKITGNKLQIAYDYNSGGYNYNLDQLYINNPVVQNWATGTLKSADSIKTIAITGRYIDAVSQIRNTFQVNKFILHGIAAIQDMNIISTNTYLGNKKLVDNSVTGKLCEPKTLLTLKRSNMNLYNGSLHLCGASGLGVPQPLDQFALDANSPIIKNGNECLAGISFRVARHEYQSADGGCGSTCCQGKDDAGYDVGFAYLEEDVNDAFKWKVRTISQTGQADQSTILFDQTDDKYDRKNINTGCIYNYTSNEVSTTSSWTNCTYGEVCRADMQILYKVHKTCP